MPDLPKTHGDTEPVKQADSLSFNPATGWISTKQYIGTLDEIKSLAAKITDEKTDDAAGTPPTVNLTVTPSGGGLATLDVSYDDDIGTGQEAASWSLQTSDYEKPIWTHPTVRALSNTCPAEYKWLRENVETVREKGNFDEVLAAWDCTAVALQSWGIQSHLLNRLDANVPPTDSADGQQVYEAAAGRTFDVKSVWIDNTGGKAYTVTVAGTGGGMHTWAELGSACCAAAKVILTYFRDGIEAFIISQYVLRKSITMPTSSKDIYGLQNVNKLVTPWQMSNKEGVPAGLKFALPDYGEWLKKAPSVSYERNKMTIEQEYWHAEDWNDYIYARATYA